MLSNFEKIGRRLARRGWTEAQRLRARLPHRPPPVILNYHRIAEESFDPWGVAVSPSRFREHLEWLSQNRTVLRLTEFAELHRRRKLPRGAIAVTIDDGYACSSAVAAPMLEEHGIPATLFLPVSLIEQGKPFWWDELEEIVLEHEGAILSLEEERISLGKRSAADRQWKPRSAPQTQRQAAYYRIHDRLSRSGLADLEKAMNHLRAQAKRYKPADPLQRPMKRVELRRAANPYIEFGSHALNHAWLPNLSPAEQRHEICDSVERCRSLTGSRPASFAYPYGMFDDCSERIVKDAGFDCACTTRDLAVSRISRNFALPRLQVGNWDAAALQTVLAQVRAD